MIKNSVFSHEFDPSIRVTSYENGDVELSVRYDNAWHHFEMSATDASELSQIIAEASITALDSQSEVNDDAN